MSSQNNSFLQATMHAAARAHTTTPRRPAESCPAPLARDRDMPVAAASPSPLVTLLQRMGYQRSDGARRPAGTAAQRRPRACAPACQPERTDGARPALHAHTHTKPCRAGWLAARPLSTGGASSLPARLSRRTHGQLNKGPASLRALWWAAVGFSWHGIEIERE